MYSPEFQSIDVILSHFVHQLDFDVSVSTVQKSDWLVFEWREISWSYKTVNYRLSIYPNFDTMDNLISWNFGATAWYDTESSRYHIHKKFLAEVDINYLIEHLESSLFQSHKYLNAIEKDRIPKGLDFKRH